MPGSNSLWIDLGGGDDWIGSIFYLGRTLAVPPRKEKKKEKNVVAAVTADLAPHFRESLGPFPTLLDLCSTVNCSSRSVVLLSGPVRFSQSPPVQYDSSRSGAGTAKIMGAGILLRASGRVWVVVTICQVAS